MDERDQPLDLLVLLPCCVLAVAVWVWPWTENMLVFGLWPVALLTAGLQIAASCLGRVPWRSRLFGSLIAALLAFAFIVWFWWSAIPACMARGYPAPSAAMAWMTAIGATAVAAAYGLAWTRRSERGVRCAEALLVLWLLGPAVPWVGETP